MTEPSALVVAAAANNAHWCNAICRAHRLKSGLGRSAWICRAPAPPLYPNLVTLGGSAQIFRSEQLRLVNALRERDLPSGWAVKDSFGSFDLSQHGFERLFEASWLMREPDLRLSRPSPDTSFVSDPAALAAWEKAWRGDETNEADTLPPRLFPETLLGNPDIAFVAIKRDGRIVAGAATNRAADIAGMSNLFTGGEPTDAVAASVATAISARFPGLPIVDYETEERARELRGAGFRTIAPLAVWLAR